ncbi:hypothetical protein DTPHA_1407102 [Enterococcus faecium]|nr:hypothetical protein DTPHA_1407102 [Enterococcus faecium]
MGLNELLFRGNNLCVRPSLMLQMIIILEGILIMKYLTMK